MNVFHYTSLEALKGILSGEQGKLCFWGTRYDSMNDPTDCTYAEEYVIPTMKNALKEYGCSEDQLEDIEAYPYIVSFSRAEDSFYMWRAYKAEIALELNYSIIEAETKKLTNEDTRSELYCGICRYPKNDTELCQIFAKLFNQAEQTVNAPMNAVREQLPLIKYSGFADEQEIRLFQFDYDLFTFNGKTGECIDGEVPNDVNIRCVRDHDIVFYKKFFLPVEALLGIIINCHDEKHFEKVKKHLEIFFKMQGITHHIDIKQTQTGKYINLNI